MSAASQIEIKVAIIFFTLYTLKPNASQPVGRSPLVGREAPAGVSRNVLR